MSGEDPTVADFVLGSAAAQVQAARAVADETLRTAVEALAEEWCGSLGRAWIASLGEDLRAVLAANPDEDP